MSDVGLSSALEAKRAELEEAKRQAMARWSVQLAEEIVTERPISTVDGSTNGVVMLTDETRAATAGG